MTPAARQDAEEDMHIGEIVREVEVVPVVEPVFEQPIEEPHGAPVTEPALEPADR